METTGDRIRSIRISLEKTGEEFGNILNVTKVAVSNWENNNRTPDADTLIKIADLGKVSVDWLLCRTDEPSNKILETDYDGHKIELEVDNNYPHDLTPDDVKNLLSQLKTIGFDVDKLISKIKE